MEKDTAALAIILPKSQKEYFEYAAALGGFRSLKEFVIFSALSKADEIIEQHKSILRSTRDKQKSQNAATNRTLKRPQRLKNAEIWLRDVTFIGKQLVHAYSRKYNTDVICSIRELRVLGISVSVEYEEAVKRSIQQQLAKRRERKMQREKNENGSHDWFDGDFSFIAGYTSGGAPYGILWEGEIESDDESAGSDEPF